MLRLASVLAPLIAAVLAAPPAVAAPSREPATGSSEAAGTREPARLQRGYLRVTGVPRGELVDALALRVPHLAFEPFEAAAGGSVGEGVAFVDLRAIAAPGSTDAEPADGGPSRSPGPGAPPEGFSLTIVVSDGRAFDRVIQAGADDRENVRLLAGTIANLLLAIEAGTVREDRGDVPLPTPEPAGPGCERECPPAPVCPAPTTEPAPEPARPAPLRIELGPAISLLTITGLGEPAAADRFAGFGGSVGVHARLRRGAFMGVALRTAGRGEAAGVRLVRQRIAVGGGYELRRDGWALEASLWGTVEPWWIVGAPVDPAPRPQWGLVARLAPSFHRARLADGRMGLSIGPVIELGASAALGGGRPSVGLVVVREGDDVRSMLRVGALELATGLSATLWFGVP